MRQSGLHALLTSGWVAGAVSTRPVARAARLLESLPFQLSSSETTDSNATVLAQKLHHDPFRRLPNTEYLTWRGFHVHAVWRCARAAALPFSP